MLTWLLRTVAGKVLAHPIRRQVREFQAATQQPRETQEELLRRILAFQADTDYGREHHFRAIQSLEDFRRHVPVAGYDAFEPYLARVRRGELRALLADRCVHMFALTSGTTSARKCIPVAPQYVADYRRGGHTGVWRVLQEHAEVKVRPVVQISGDWQEFRT